MQDTNKHIITQKDVIGYSREELLALLKQFEGPGRSKKFNAKAASNEKRKTGEAFEYDFSWSWLVEQAKKNGLAYGKNHQWGVQETTDNAPTKEQRKEVVVIGSKVPTQKRTMEVSEDVLKLWDEALKNKPCKAEFLSIAMERFIRDLRAGNVVIQFEFVFKTDTSMSI